MSPVWRQGHQVPRNIYKDDEPVAMLATEELAAEIVAGMNRDATASEYYKRSSPYATRWEQVWLRERLRCYRTIFGSKR